MAIKIQYLGWDSFLITSNKGVRLITDPFLSGKPNRGLLPSPVSPQEIHVDLIAASHASYDHLGEAFEIMSHCNAKLLGSVDIMFHANKEGIGNDRLELMVSGCAFEYEDIVVRALDARHISWRIADGIPVTGQPLCYIIQMQDGPTIFFGGDTSITYDLKLYGELYRPDIAMLGIGGVMLDGGRILAELDPYEAAVAAEFLGVKTVIPMHYIGTEPVEQFKTYFSSRKADGECLVMSPGQELIL